MAVLNGLYQPWSPTASLRLYYFNNQNHYCINNCKLHSLSHSYRFSVLSSLYAPTKPNHTASRLSQMPTHFSKSGTFSSQAYILAVFFLLYFCLVVNSDWLGRKEIRRRDTENLNHICLLVLIEKVKYLFDSAKYVLGSAGKRLWSSEFRLLCISFIFFFKAAKFIMHLIDW